MALRYDGVKATIASAVKDAVYPRQTDYSSSLDASSGLDQPFIPFSTRLSTMSIYSHTEGEATISIASGGSMWFSTVTTLSIGWNSFPLNLADRVSKSLCTLSVEGSILVGASTSNTYFYGTIDDTHSLAFSISVPEFVHTVYPIEKRFAFSSLPIIVVDIAARPYARNVYITPSMLIEGIDIAVLVYSRYPDELDKLCSGIENAVINLRDSLPPKWLSITPGRVSDIGFISPDILMRELHYVASILVQGE